MSIQSSITPQSPQETELETLDIYQHYKDSKYMSIKHTSYFQVYEELLARYRNKKITFVEVGVLNGGSLFMWRSYFGHQARIIGIDFNPGAKKWQKEGFEIFIGNQADPMFWDDFFKSVGEVDIILDDGGHTNEQQIITTNKTVPYIRDGGMLIVEDTHSSYLKKYGNPSKYSFMKYVTNIIDSINSRFPFVGASQNDLNKSIYSVSVYESIVCFHIDRSKCFVSAPTTNQGVPNHPEDFTNHVYKVKFSWHASVSQNLSALQYGVMRLISKALFGNSYALIQKVASRKLGRFFR